MTYRDGDFVELAPDLDDADIVTLDRVICCYPDMTALVNASAARANHVWAAVLPREDRFHVRMGLAFINLMQRIRRRPFRVFGHSTQAVEDQLTSLGYARAYRGTSFIWQVLVFTRA